MRPILLTYNVVPIRCWCPLYHVITLDPHCLCRTASFCIQLRGVDISAVRLRCKCGRQVSCRVRALITGVNYVMILTLVPW